MKSSRFKKYLKLFLLSFILLNSLTLSTIGLNEKNSVEKDLPPPIEVDMILEESIFRRMSVREFTDDPVSDEDLSTILWAAFGLRDDGKHTISKINNSHSAVIYVINEEAAYKYDPINHSLVVYKEGDFIGNGVRIQYEAPYQLGLCWDASKADPNQGSVELGEIGQNIQFMANALDLGTVVTGEIPPAINGLGLPENEEGLIMMPLGHPEVPYDFIDRPMWISKLPKIEETTKTLTYALTNLDESIDFDGELTEQEISQIIWSSYGFSYYIDNSEQEPVHLKRHRTVPSAHGYYPFEIYTITEEGIYRYYNNILIDIISKYLQITNAPVDFFGLPIITFLYKIKSGDFREDIADITSQPNLAQAPLIIIPVLNLENAKELAMESAIRFWFYEAGASAHNVMLESTALDLSSRIIYPIDPDLVNTILDLNENYTPSLLIAVGK
ncbi:MAG: nitroreductase family protein [Thermoplasmatales archaeon]|nr:nitroreductase family protein [Thermoplasmatales archaeon]